jgi:hypothetical protein
MTTTMNRSTFTTGFVFNITKPADPYAPRVPSHPIYQANADAAKAELERKFKPTAGYVLTLDRTVVR